MVAMALFDLIIAAIWLGGLTVYLLGQAVLGWVKLRYARTCARQASRLSEATRAIARQRTAASIHEGSRSTARS
jgi:hypothetical protein